jgi:ABC-type multidrug transport system fused ATPase/permease subunit
MAFRDKFTASFELLRRLLFLVRPYGLGKAAVVLAVMILQGLLQVAGVTSIFPFLALATDPEGFRASGIGQRILALLPPLENSQLLFWAGVFSIATLVASNAINLLSDYVRASYCQGLAHWLRREILGRIASQPWSYFLRRNSGELLKRAATDGAFFAGAVLMPLLEAFTRLVTVFGLLAILLAIDWRVSSVGAFCLAMYFVIAFALIQGKRRKWSEEYKIAEKGVMREAQQFLGGVKTIKIRHAEAYFLDRFALHSRNMSSVIAKFPTLVHLPKYVLEPLVFGSVVAAVLWHAGNGQSLASIIPLVGLIALTGYRLLPAMTLVYTQIVQALLCRHGIDEVYDELRNEKKVAFEALGTKEQPLRWSKSIEFSGVSFAYETSTSNVLQNIGFIIPKFKSLGIVGSTGSGKSTLVDLLMGLHRPSAGVINVDGKPLDDASIRSWQAGIGYVPQDIFLIDDTIKRNIALGVPDAEIDMSRLLAVAEAACIRDFVEKDQPLGFDTMVGERGVRLSGGQRQRIALARALYPQPELLILDEATSALDNQTEAEVVRAINSLHGKITMVVVAHRLSTIQRCDSVLELKDGTAALWPDSSQLPRVQN